MMLKENDGIITRKKRRSTQFFVFLVMYPGLIAQKIITRDMLGYIWNMFCV